MVSRRINPHVNLQIARAYLMISDPGSASANNLLHGTSKARLMRATVSKGGPSG